MRQRYRLSTVAGREPAYAGICRKMPDCVKIALLYARLTPLYAAIRATDAKHTKQRKTRQTSTAQRICMQMFWFAHDPCCRHTLHFGACCLCPLVGASPPQCPHNTCAQSAVVASKLHMPCTSTRLRGTQRHLCGRVPVKSVAGRGAGLRNHQFRHHQHPHHHFLPIWGGFGSRGRRA